MESATKSSTYTVPVSPDREQASHVQQVEAQVQTLQLIVFVNLQCNKYRSLYEKVLMFDQNSMLQHDCHL